MGDLLNNSEMLKKLGIDSANQWMIYDERFEKFFKFLSENVTDANILTDQEVLERDKLIERGLWLNETERLLKLQQIESENPGLLKYKEQDVEALADELKNMEQATYDYIELINEMQSTKHSINNNLSELEYKIVPLQTTERELLSECQAKASQLEELQRQNSKLCAEINLDFTMQQVPPLFMHQLPLEQYFLKCDSFMQYFTLYMKDNFKIQEYVELESTEMDMPKTINKLENLQNSIQYYTLEYIKEKAKAKATKALCDQLDLNRITCINLADMAQETHDLQLLNENHLKNTHETLMNSLVIHVQQRIEQRMEMVLYENTKEKLERAVRRRENDKQLTNIISDALLNAELIWIAIQLDMEKKRNFNDNSKELCAEAEAVWERVQTMRSLSTSNKGAICGQFLQEIASQLSAHLGQNVRSAEAKTCLYEYEKFGRLLAYSLQSMLNEKSHTFVHEQLADLKRLEEKLHPFVYDSPLEQPMFEHARYLCPIYNVVQQQLHFDESLRHLRTQFQEKVLHRMENEKLYRYSQLLWIWFLTAPERMIHAIDELKKFCAKIPALTSSVMRPGGGLQPNSLNRFVTLKLGPGAAWQTLFLLCALAYCINVASGEGRVVCYYTNWSVYRPGTAKFNPQNINPYLCTHLVYAFGGFTKDNQMKPFDKYQDIEQGGYAKFTGLKTYNKQLKTMIAIGGWNEASSRFSPLVASNDRRQHFIKNILKFLRQNHFDGIDLDWEYPAHREGGKSRDRDNYAQFVQELRAEFEREAEKTGRSRLLLTMAVPAGIEYIDKGYDVPKLNKYLDWFNVLTYDFHSSHEPSVNHHAPLYSLEDDSEYNYDAELNIDYSIKYYLKAGADRDKLVLGIPTYGRSYTLINEESTELGAPSEGPGEQGDATREKGYLAYYEICQTLKDDPEWTVVQPNANVMGPYAYRRNQWVGYDDEAIVRKKAEYVVAHGLGGIMFWAIDNDDFRGTCSGKPYPLIEAAKEAMLDAYSLGINEVAKPSGPQKPSRSRSRDNGSNSNKNRINSKPEASTRRPSGTRRPASSSTTTSAPSTTIRLTEAEGQSLYIGGRGSTTPPPPTTPDPGSDFKCEEEGFFQHPRDCKKYYWCLDSGPSGLGIVAHQFTCPSGLYFNPAADSCDFARNVPCKTKKSTTASPVSSTSTTTTTTARPTSSYNRVTAAPVARPVYPRITSTTTTTTTTTTPRTTTPAEDEELLEYEEDGDEAQTSSKLGSEAEEDPQVIKELIDLIRKVGGVEQLEKHLLRNKDGSITLKENSASGAPTTPSTISKSLYDRVLSRPEALGTFSRNRLNTFKIQSTQKPTPASSSSADDSSSQNNNSKYSSVLRGNSRQGPQNEGLEQLNEFDGFLKERKQYVTINRNRGSAIRDEQDADDNSNDEIDDEEQIKQEPTETTRRPFSSATPSYTSVRRSRPTTTAPPVESVTELEQEQEQAAVKEQTQTKQYATLSRARGRTTERPESTASDTAGVSVSSTTNRYKYFERTRPTKSSSAASVGIENDDEDDEEDDGDEPQHKNVTVQRNQSSTSTTTTTNTRKYASIGRRTTTTTTPETTPETTTTVIATETAKASNTNNNNNSNNISNSVKTNNVLATTPRAPITITTTQPQPDTTITNETTEPIELSTNIPLSTSNTNIQATSPTPTTTTTPTPTIASIIQKPTTSIDILSLADGINNMLELQFTTMPPSDDASSQIPTLDLNLNNLAQVAPTTTTTTTSESELLATTRTTTANSKQNSIDNDDDDNNDDNNDNDSDDKIRNNIDNDKVTKTKTQSKYATIRRRINSNTNNNNKNNADAVNNDASLNVGGNSNGNVNSIRNTYSGRRQPQRTQEQQPELTTTELPVIPTSSISSPRPFGYPRRRTRPTKPQPTTTTVTNNDNDNSNDNVHKPQNDDIASIGKTRLSKLDRPKNRYQLSRTRGSTTTTTSERTTTTTGTGTSSRRFNYGSRNRAQVTKLVKVDDQSTQHIDDADSEEETDEDDVEDADDDETTTKTTPLVTTTTEATTATIKPTLKRIRVLKYRRPLQSTAESSSNSTTDRNTNTITNTEITNNNNNNTNTTTTNSNTTPIKRFRKIVRKLRPVETSSESAKQENELGNGEQGETTTTTRKPFKPSRTRFGEAAAQDHEVDSLEENNDVEQEQQQQSRRPIDLQSLRNLKNQQSRGEPTDGVINSRLQGREETAERENSELQRLRDKVKAEQARGSGEEGVVNDRLKKLLAEKAVANLDNTDNEDNDSSEKPISGKTVGPSSRPFFRRKLVAKRPYAPSAGTTAPTKPTPVFSSPRPTTKFVRRKNGRFDPFNSNVRNRGEGFVRSDARGARLPGTDRFQQQDKDSDDDEEDFEEQQEQPQSQQVLNARPLGNQATAVRRPFVPKSKLQQPPQDQNKNSDDDDDDGDDDDDDDDDNNDNDEDGGEDGEEDDEQQKEQDAVSSREQQNGDNTTKPKSNTPNYRSKDNRAPPGSRPNFAPTANGGNVPFNPRNRQSNSSNGNTSPSSSTTPASRFGGGGSRSRVVNRPPGVANPNLTLRPVANNYERTTPLTPLKPAPFIPSNNRSYERKYTGPSTETSDVYSENPLIEDLNIDALNARNKKIFDIHSKKHTTLKPKVVAKPGTELDTDTVVETETMVESDEQQRQGYVTTTPSTPTTSTSIPTSTTLSTDTTNTDKTDTENENETAQPPQHDGTHANNANEATTISSLPQDKTSTTTTSSPPPATTLLHVFTLLDGDADDDQKPTGRPIGSKTTAMEPKHKLIEINRIVEINSKQAKATQRKSKANQDFGALRVESLPHVEQLGEISVVKYVHLVDGSDIQINDGHSTVADYTPTEPNVLVQPQSSVNSAPVRNSLPQLEEGDSDLERSGKSLLPEVILGGLETSTISLEGLFDSARKAKQLNVNSISSMESSTDQLQEMELDTSTVPSTTTAATATTSAAIPATYVRPIVPLLRPESNESSPLIISIANLDKVILSKVPTLEGGESESQSESVTDATGEKQSSTTDAIDIVPDSNSAFSVRHASVLQAPTNNQLSNGLEKRNTYTTTATQLTTNSNSTTQTANVLTNNTSISENISYSTETHVVRRKKARRGRGRRLRHRQNNTNTTTSTPTTTSRTTTTTIITAAP